MTAANEVDIEDATNCEVDGGCGKSAMVTANLLETNGYIALVIVLAALCGFFAGISAFILYYRAKPVDPTALSTGK